jgi:hypothetical protein
MQCSAHYDYSIDCVMDTELLSNLGYCVIVLIVIIVTQMKSHAWAGSYSLHDGYSSLHIECCVLCFISFLAGDYNK